MQKCNVKDSKDFLSFECYRIRRRFSLPMPITELPEWDVQVRGFSQTYPWQIWCLWALEERLNQLNFLVTQALDENAKAKAISDLNALAQWPRYSVAVKLDLPFAHAVQLMAQAVFSWHWLPLETVVMLKLALQRAVKEGLALAPAETANLTTADTFLAKVNSHRYLHNISLNAQAALAFAAEVIQHSQRSLLSQRFAALMEARFTLNSTMGLTEGLSYDGYFAYFVFNWLQTQENNFQQRVLEHSAIIDLERMALVHACPGAIWKSAEIGDVEPEQMPFIWSALAKLNSLQFCPKRLQLLESIPLNILRSDALLNLALGPSTSTANLTASPILQCSNALALASGYQQHDLSAVMSFCRSPMSHIQADSGTLLIGHAGYWWVTDPGYQQYLNTAERSFTIGTTAHNTPVINGYALAGNVASLLLSGKINESEDDVAFTILNLTACYPPSAKVDAAIRTMWRLGSEHIVVCDTILAPQANVQYNWHINANAYWSEKGGAVSLFQDDCNKIMWIQSGQQQLSLAQQHRLRGSRGQCTLKVEQPLSVVHHWWCFSLAEEVPDFQAENTDAIVGRYRLSLNDLLSAEEQLESLDLLIHRDQIQVFLISGDQLLGRESHKTRIVSLLVNGKVHQQVSTETRQVNFSIPAIGMGDEVRLTAHPNGASKEVLDVTELVLTKRECQAIRSVPLRVYIEEDNGRVTGHCQLLPDALEGVVEYAFYLIVNGQQKQVQWYKPNATHTFTLLPEEHGNPVNICGFVRVVSAPEKKLSATSITLGITVKQTNTCQNAL